MSRPTVSVVIPCLNEAETLPMVLRKLRLVFLDEGIDGEVIVVDNGSTDRSREVAQEHGAQVVGWPNRGYGAALRAGMRSAKGRFIVMGDADDSYDFLELPKLLRSLGGGADMVMGCRMPAGGGRIRRGAMPWLHRWIGNPFFTWLALAWFDVRVRDIYCGLRGIRADMVWRLGLRESGMVFACEMVIKATRAGLTIHEVPITLHPDGRRRNPHLKTWRDGWRTLVYFVKTKLGEAR